MYTSEGKRTVEYRTWLAILERCYSKNGTSYPRYGGRGVVVCVRWKDSYADFLDDMGRRPLNKCSIEREDNDGNYTPENCKWATRKEQMRNTHRAVKYTLGNKSQLLIEWAEELDIPVNTLRTRLRDGWPIEDILTKPNDCQNLYLTHDGLTLTLAQWSRRLNIKAPTLCQRMKRGWSVEKALTTPVKRKD